MIKTSLILFLLFNTCSLTVTNEIIEGSFILGIGNELFYQIYEDETDEYIEKSLIWYNILNQEKDTLIQSALYLSTDKYNDGNLIFSDGIKIVCLNISKKMKSIVGVFGHSEKPIIKILSSNQLIYYFIWDQVNSIISFYRVENNDSYFIFSIPLKGIEYHGFKAIQYNNQVYFSIEGLLYCYNIKQNKLNRIYDSIIKDFELDDEIIIISVNDGVYFTKLNNSIIADERLNFSKLFSIVLIYTDKIFLAEGKVYYFNSQESKNYVYENYNLKECKVITIYKTKHFAVNFINNNFFSLQAK